MSLLVRLQMDQGGVGQDSVSSKIVFDLFEFFYGELGSKESY